MGSYFILAGVLLLAGIVFDIGLFYFLSYLCIAIYAVSRWYVPHSLKKLESQRSLDSHAFLGDEVAINVRLENPHRLAVPWLSVWDSVPLELGRERGIMQVLNLPGRSRAEFSYTIKPRRRGYYRLGPLYLVSSDLFGFVPQTQSQRPVSHITVYPRVTPLAELGLPSRLPFGSLRSRERLFSDPTRPLGIRDYQSGDSQRHIHWKASGHLRRLVVKTFEPAVSLETALMLNLNRDEYSMDRWREGSEFGIEVAASLAAHLIDRRQSAGFFTNGLDPLGSTGSASFDPSSGRLEVTDGEQQTQSTAIAPRPGRAQLMKLLESLARVQVSTGRDFIQWLPEATLGLGWGTTVMVITPDGDEQACEVMHRLSRRGFNVILIVTELVYFAPIEQRAAALGFRAYRAAARSDLDEWRA